MTRFPAGLYAISFGAFHSAGSPSGDLHFVAMSLGVKKNLCRNRCDSGTLFFDHENQAYKTISSLTLSTKYVTLRGYNCQGSVKKSKASIIVYFDTRGQNERLGHCIFTRAVSESPVWPHVTNHIFLYKFMRARVGSPFTDMENAP